MAHSPAESDDELLLRLQSGDEQAFLALYRRRQPAIYRFALHMSGSAAIAEDVTQEVFLALIRDSFGYDPELGSLPSYLYGIARKLVLRVIERGRSDTALDEESDDAQPYVKSNSDPLGDLTRKEGIHALRRAVQSLPHRYREVVVLCDLEEVDYSDAAAILGCPVGTVRSRLHRARALLLEKMRQENAQAPLKSLRPIRSLI